jgi:uncharacterized membrane protein
MTVNIHPAWRARFTGTLAIVLLAAAHGAAQAQSSYTLTVLQAPNTKPIYPSSIDAQNRVLGSAEYITGYGLLPSFGWDPLGAPIFGWLYSSFAVRWPASTAASMAPAKLTGSQAGPLQAASADGNLIVAATLLQVYNTATGKKLAALFPPRLASTATEVNVPLMVGISNGGTATLNYSLAALGYTPAPEEERAGLWSTSTNGQILPFGGYVGARAVSVNGQGQVAGAVYEQGLPTLRAAIWTNGALNVIDHTPGRGSAALAVNQAGQALLRVSPVTVMSDTLTDGYGNPFVYTQLRYGTPSYVLSVNGVETPINPVSGQAVVVPAALNASGVVVGRMGAVGVDNNLYTPSPLKLATYDAVPGRAFIWKNGVTTDLTTLVTSKGVKLPTGAVLADAIAINDQGSILARMLAANGTLSYVRLTAKP